MEEQAREKLIITLELCHPINHDGRVYSRGLHDLDAALAKHFLMLRDPINGSPTARLPENKAAPTKGTVTLDKSNAASPQRA